QKGMISLSPPTICNSAGRKTFESMGALPNRKYAVVTRSGWTSNDDNVVVFQSIEEAMDRLAEFTGHVIVSGGGEIYRETLPMASTLHLSTIDIEPEGDVFFPSIPNTFEVVFEQHFTSNINYCYQIWKKG
ncbi:dihydrofolate reductase, partial [Klebsiella pneumoniae]